MGRVELNQHRILFGASLCRRIREGGDAQTRVDVLPIAAPGTKTGEEPFIVVLASYSIDRRRKLL